MDSLARKAAQQIIDLQIEWDKSRGKNTHKLDLLSQAVVAEQIESALAPMREALRALIPLFLKDVVSGKVCIECRALAGFGAEFHHMNGCVVARAAEVLKNEK
jgi:hypothetical protein